MDLGCFEVVRRSVKRLQRKGPHADVEADSEYLRGYDRALEQVLEELDGIEEDQDYAPD